jgi:nucleotide-binding universal stress UspA family protein
MAVKSILAAFSGDPESCGALKLALDLQRRHSAWVTGVAWHAESLVKGRYRSFLSRGVTEMLEERELVETASVRADFDRRVAAAGDPERALFLELDTTPDQTLAELARGYDLVVMSRHAAELGREHGASRPDAVALRCGRPVLVAPKDHAGDALAGPVVLAWDGKRAAARALGDALHLLELRTRFVVVSVTNDRPKPQGAGDDVMNLLWRHEIEAERIVRGPGRRSIPQTLVDVCHEVGASLLVMGAYEHSKLQEDLLGGVTKDILGEADLPVLMSH